MFCISVYLSVTVFNYCVKKNLFFGVYVKLPLVISFGLAPVKLSICYVCGQLASASGKSYPWIWREVEEGIVNCLRNSSLPLGRLASVQSCTVVGWVRSLVGTKRTVGSDCNTGCQSYCRSIWF